jgi:hypothetical protein
VGPPHHRLGQLGLHQVLGELEPHLGIRLQVHEDDLGGPLPQPIQVGIGDLGEGLTDAHVESEAPGTIAVQALDQSLVEGRIGGDDGSHESLRSAGRARGHRVTPRSG